VHVYECVLHCSVVARWPRKCASHSQGLPISYRRTQWLSDVSILIKRFVRFVGHHHVARATLHLSSPALLQGWCYGCACGDSARGLQALIEALWHMPTCRNARDNPEWQWWSNHHVNDVSCYCWSCARWMAMASMLFSFMTSAQNRSDNFLTGIYASTHNFLVRNKLWEQKRRRCWHATYLSAGMSMARSVLVVLIVTWEFGQDNTTQE